MEGHNMMFDAARNLTIMFGGYGYPYRSPPLFVYDGVDWEIIEPTGDWPQPRAHYGMAYDSDREVVVIFGGFQGNFDYLGDTWEWDGEQWEQKFPVDSPSDRIRHAMAYHPGIQATVLFGGFDETYEVKNDTWVWDGVNWQEVSVSDAPSPRYTQITYSDQLDNIVLFGGSDTGSSSGTMNDTWLFDGVDWVEAMPLDRPPNVHLHVLVYDKLRERCVTFGGIPSGGGYTHETWEFDGVNWEISPASSHPIGRAEHAACFDSVRNRTVLFGGYSWNGPANDTWEYYDVPTSTPSPTPTSTPTVMPTPFPTCTPTASPACPDQGVSLEMPSHTFAPGDACYLTAHICNLEPDPWRQSPFFCLLEYAGAYWYHPDWTTDVNWEIIETIPPGLTDVPVIDPFSWPLDAGVGSGFRFISAVTDPEMTRVIGVVGEWEFGWN